MFLANGAINDDVTLIFSPNGELAHSLLAGVHVRCLFMDVRVLHARVHSHVLPARDGAYFRRVFIPFEYDWALSGSLGDDVLNDAFIFLVEFSDHAWFHAHAEGGSPHVINACYEFFLHCVPNHVFFRPNGTSSHVRVDVPNGIPLVGPPSKVHSH